LLLDSRLLPTMPRLHFWGNCGKSDSVRENGPTESPLPARCTSPSAQSPFALPFSPNGLLHRADCASPRTSNLTRSQQTDSFHPLTACSTTPAGFVGITGWLPSEQVAGFNRNRRLLSSESASGPCGNAPSQRRGRGSLFRATMRALRFDSTLTTIDDQA
jgi:hypothetical protein